MSIKPTNDYLIIDPVKYVSFIASEKETYEQVGIVTAVPKHLTELDYLVGKKVYFDSWVASKYPKNDKEWFWLVPMADVRAVEDE